MKNILSRLFNNIFVFVGLLFIGLGLVFYVVLGRGAVDTLTSQMLERKLVIARGGASSIQAFFGLFGNSLKTLGRSEISQEDIDDFVNDWKDTPVSGVILTDEDGVVLANSTRTEEINTGADISDRDYFNWAKEAKQGEIFVGEPVVSRVGVSTGKFVAVTATPIFRNGEFRGVLAAAMFISELTQDYLEPLKTSENTRVYVIDPSGVIIFGPFEKLIRVNYFDYLAENKVLGYEEINRVLKERVSNTAEGKLKIALPNEKTGKITPFLVAHSPIYYNNGSYWTLAVAIPEADALTYMTPLYIRGLILLVITFMVLMAFSARLAKRMGYTEGFSEHGVLHKEKNHKAS